MRCQECRCVSRTAPGWIAKLVDDDEEAPDENPCLAFYCPVCAEREFSLATKRPYE